MIVLELTREIEHLQSGRRRRRPVQLIFRMKEPSSSGIGGALVLLSAGGVVPADAWVAATCRAT